jgi:cell division protein FtsW (lipid II flippase)
MHVVERPRRGRIGRPSPHAAVARKTRPLVALGTTPLAGSPTRARFAWRSLAEAALSAAAIAALLPLFDVVASLDTGRDERFADSGVTVRGLPERVLPAICSSHGALADDVVRERLCSRADFPFGSGRAAALDRMPAALASAWPLARGAFVAPLADAQARLADLRLRQREGVGDLLALANDIESTSAAIEPYVERYRLDGAERGGPVPLACAFDGVAASLASAGAGPGAKAGRARANAVLLLAAALDGHHATAALAANAALPAAADGCAGLALRDALAQAAALMADARGAPIAAAKNEAMRSLLRTAGWQWAAWMAAGLLLLNMSRRPALAPIGVAFALATWAAAAWVGGVPSPFGGAQSFVPARDPALAAPAPFVVALAAAALAVLLLAPGLRKSTAGRAQAPASAYGYPGLVVATGIGWLLLLDLSANGHYANRYLSLYHQAHLWLGMLAFTTIAFVRQPLARALAWTLSVIDGIAGAAHARLGAVGGAAALAALALALVAAVGALMSNVRQLTSEVGRLWLIVGAAWFFFLRGTPLTERLARRGGSIGSLARYVAPLAFVVAVLVGAMLVTRDMGPLLIDAYGAGAFVAASIAMWWYQRTTSFRSAHALAGALFVAWIVAATWALFRLGSIDEVAAARIENVAAPLASANDQLALVTWFRQAAPPAGFGLGAVPWCGYGASGGCAGVPAQIQSDYTFTAIVGAFGWSAAWAITLGCTLWLHALVRRHAAATRGEPRLVRIGARIENDAQALASWVCLTWVVLALCQLAVTVAGNLAVIPLTGVTFPFVSFGMTSLVLNMSMLALAIDVTAQGSLDG